jgi:hypothetical protein
MNEASYRAYLRTTMRFTPEQRLKLIDELNRFMRQHNQLTRDMIDPNSQIGALDVLDHRHAFDRRWNAMIADFEGSSEG